MCIIFNLRDHKISRLDKEIRIDGFEVFRTFNSFIETLFKMILTVLVTYFSLAFAYSPIEDDKIIRSFLSELPTDHAVVARKLVHKANWASAGTISTAHEIQGFPMVNIISIADSAKNAKSTGNIYFLLTPLDFTEQDLDVMDICKLKTT